MGGNAYFHNKKLRLHSLATSHHHVTITLHSTGYEKTGNSYIAGRTAKCFRLYGRNTKTHEQIKQINAFKMLNIDLIYNKN